MSRCNKSLYELIISQLKEDGFSRLAAAVSEASMTSHTISPSSRLSQLVTLGVAIEKERGIQLPTEPDEDGDVMDITEVLREIRGVDFDAEVVQPVPYPNYQTRYITTHKNSCTCASFSADGKFIATGSQDTSIKLMDVDKMLMYNQLKGDANDDMQLSRPVMKTFYDHSATVNSVEFHPYLPLLASSSSDCTIKVYEYNASVKKALKSFQDTHNIRSICFHPSGDYLLSAGDHTAIRLWDVNAQKAYINPKSEKNHFGPVNKITYTSDGKLYASCSADGSIKLWDGVTNECINTITNAHSGREVCTVQFSKNKKYLLSSGKDSTMRIWDVIAGCRPLKRITTSGAKQPTWDAPLHACFSYNEDFILATEENLCIVWDTRSGELIQRLAGHNSAVRWIAASPTEPHALTCSDDHRARFWVEEGNFGTQH